MANDFQLTTDPERQKHIEEVKSQAKGPTKVTVEMYSGISYTGTAVGEAGGSRQVNKGPKLTGGYIIIETNDGRFRLDALDIKSCKSAS